jgi:hypothetical protein
MNKQLETHKSREEQKQRQQSEARRRKPRDKNHTKTIDPKK